MSNLPSGTVTFLFTDVEGSTTLRYELGADAYAEALAEHRRVIREACSRHGGVEVDTQGDSFFVAFPTAPGAVAAAEAIRDGLVSGQVWRGWRAPGGRLPRSRSRDGRGKRHALVLCLDLEAGLGGELECGGDLFACQRVSLSGAPGRNAARP